MLAQTIPCNPAQAHVLPPSSPLVTGEQSVLQSEAVSFCFRCEGNLNGEGGQPPLCRLLK